MKDFSLQLYSLRDIPTLKERLQIASDAGYTGVEFAGYEDYSAEELKSLLESLSLRPVGTHVGINDENIEQNLQYALELGLQHATIPGTEIASNQEALEKALLFDQYAEKFNKAGISFSYHNHAHEFAKDADEYYLETMIKNTKHLQFELDVYWAAFADVDPVEFINRYAGRFSLIHFKEIAADKENVELGTGVLDFATIKAAAFAQGAKEIIVEQEHYTMEPAQSVVVDAQYMKTLS